MEKLTNEFKIEFTKGDTYALAIKFKNISEDLRLAYFSVKESPDDSPLIQKSLGAGISKIDDRKYKNEKTYKVQLQSADTINLEARVQYLYDIQVTVGNVVKTVLHGVFVLGNTITGTRSATTQELEVAIDNELETEVLTTPATKGIEYETDPVALAKIGDLAKLDTDNKEDIVNAINEVNKHTDTNIEDINNIKNGTFELPNAKNVTGTINGKNIGEIFENDGITVKKAKVCEYASLDISKGTIEERLTNLGFKQGNITINDNVGSVVQITRQGNYVKCLFAWGDEINNMQDFLRLDSYGYQYSRTMSLDHISTGINFGTIDNDFIPKTTLLLPIVLKTNNNGATSFFKARLTVYGEETTSKGQVKIFNDFNENFDYAGVLIGVLFNLGYEVSPIE